MSRVVSVVFLCFFFKVLGDILGSVIGYVVNLLLGIE